MGDELRIYNGLWMGYHICTHNKTCKYGKLGKGATASSLEATSLLQYIEHKNGDRI